MRRIVTRFFISLGIFIAITLFGFVFWVRDRYVVPILAYHHVGGSLDKFEKLNIVSVQSFEEQMFFLKKNGYKVVSFKDLIEGINKGYAFAHNTVVIQFDDGYEDNYTNAFPVLKKYQFSAMVFLISDSIGTPGFLTWNQVKEMESYDFKAGAHTRRHSYLPEISLEEAKEEIVGSKRIIEEHLEHAIDYFAYPSGGFTKEVQAFVKEAGYKAAVTTNRGRSKFNNEDLYALKRIRMNENDSKFMSIALWAKCSGYYNLFRKKKDGGNQERLYKIK